MLVPIPLDFPPSAVRQLRLENHGRAAAGLVARRYHFADADDLAGGNRVPLRVCWGGGDGHAVTLRWTPIMENREGVELSFTLPV